MKYSEITPLVSKLLDRGESFSLISELLYYAARCERFEEAYAKWYILRHPYTVNRLNSAINVFNSHS